VYLPGEAVGFLLQLHKQFYLKQVKM